MRNREKRKILKKFKNAKFDYKQYLKDFYVENGNAYISANVKSIDSIISGYSIKEYEWLRKDFAEYIERNAYYIPVEYPIIIEICGCDFDEKEKGLIMEVINSYFGLKLIDANLEIEDNKRRSLKLLTGSIFVMAIVILFGYLKISGAVAELVALLFWFFTWEFVSSAWLDRSELNIKKLEAGQLASVKVIFESKNK